MLVLSRREVEELLDLDALLDALAAAHAELSAGDASLVPRVGAFAADGILGAMVGLRALRRPRLQARHALPGEPRPADAPGGHRALRPGDGDAGGAHGRHVHHRDAHRRGGCARDPAARAARRARARDPRHRRAVALGAGDVPPRARVRRGAGRRTRRVRGRGPRRRRRPRHDRLAGAGRPLRVARARDARQLGRLRAPAAPSSTRRSSSGPTSSSSSSATRRSRRSPPARRSSSRAAATGSSSSARSSPGRLAGRSSDEQITLYKSVGVAVQDLAAAALVLAAARERGAGQEIELEEIHA